MKTNRIPRRLFLRRAAFGAVAPMIVPSSVLGNATTPAPSNRIAIGHIGVGGQGSGLLNNFLGVAGAQSVAACDCFASRRERARKTVNDRYAARSGEAGWKGCDTYRDFRELLARPDIDAVVIATPDHWHVPVGLHAVRAGKDTYIEKPLGVAMTWNWALRDEIRRRGTVFQYGTQQRSGRNFRFACELVQNGVIGTLKHMDVWAPALGPGALTRRVAADDRELKVVPPPADLDFDLWLGPAPAAPYTEVRCSNQGAYHVYDYALGYIAGWGVHPVDIAQWGHDGDRSVPVEYEGAGGVPAEGLFDTLATWDVRCRYADGVAMRFMDADAAKASVSAYRKFEGHGTTFHGDRGWVSVDRGGIHASNPAWLRMAWKAGDLRLYDSPNHYANFADCVRSRRPTICPIDVAVGDDLISHLSDICIRLKRPVRWDPTAERIVGDETAARMLHRPLRAPWTV